MYDGSTLFQALSHAWSTPLIRSHAVGFISRAVEPRRYVPRFLQQSGPSFPRLHLSPRVILHVSRTKSGYLILCVMCVVSIDCGLGCILAGHRGSSVRGRDEPPRSGQERHPEPPQAPFFHLQHDRAPRGEHQRHLWPDGKLLTYLPLFFIVVSLPTRISV